MPSNTRGDDYCDQHDEDGRVHADLEVRCLDVRRATSSAFKGVKLRQVAKSRGYSSEPHDLSAAWAKRRPWRAFIKAFVAH